MANGQISLALLEDALNLVERVLTMVRLTKSEISEIQGAVSEAVIKTETVFGELQSREIVQNSEVAEAWRNAGQILKSHLPTEKLGDWLQNKGEAWANPQKWSPDILKENKLKIEEIKSRINKITHIRRRILRPNDL